MVHNFLVAILLVIQATSFAGKPSSHSAGSRNSGSTSAGSGSTDPTEFASENRDRIRNGIDAGVALGEALKEGNFRESLQKIGTNIGLFFGILGPLASIALSFISTADSPELKFMKEKFKEVNNKLDIITAEFEEVKNAIDWSAVTVSYGTYERKIKAAEANLNRIYEHEGSVREQVKDYFIEQYDNDFSNSLLKLYDGIMNEDHVFSSNILDAVLTQTKFHKTKFEQFSLGLVQLLVQGIMVRISYSAMKEQETQHLVNEWDRKMLALKQKVQEVSDEIKTGYLTQLRSDAEDMIRRSSELNNEELKQQLYDFVNEKYDWRYFFVAVYDNLVGDDKHYASVCGDTGLAFYNLYEKNVVISSQDKSFKRRNYQNRDRQRIMDSVPRDVFWCRSGLDRTSIKRAKSLVDNILGKAQSNCSPNQLYLGVEIHDDFHSSYPEGHANMKSFSYLSTCGCAPTPFNWSCPRIYWKHQLIAFG